MNEEKTIDTTISRYQHEFDMAIADRNAKRWFVAFLITFFLLISTVVFCIYRETCFYDEVITVEQESETGYNNYIGNDGNITN